MTEKKESLRELLVPMEVNTVCGGILNALNRVKQSIKLVLGHENGVI